MAQFTLGSFEGCRGVGLPDDGNSTWQTGNDYNVQEKGKCEPQDHELASFERRQGTLGR